MGIADNIKKNDEFVKRMAAIPQNKWRKMNLLEWDQPKNQDPGPVPRFEIDEVFEIRGYLFRVSHIGKRKMILRPMRPA